MRKLLTAILAVLALCGLSVVAAPATAEPAAPAATQAAATGWAMGGLPNYWTICAANGVGGTYWADLVRKWTWAGHELDLRVQNRCDGYSITNRFTFEYMNSATESCAEITNGHRTWSPARQKYIWDRNPIVWVNINNKCTTDSVSYDHQVQLAVGWLLGLYPDAQDCNCVMGNTVNDIYSIRYVVLHDILDMDVVYRH